MSTPGFGEIIVILIVALIVFGPRKLPEIGRSVGKAVREFRRATSSLRAELEDGLDVEERPRYGGSVGSSGRRRTRHPRAADGDHRSVDDGEGRPDDAEAAADGRSGEDPDALSTTDRPDHGAGDGPD